MALRAFCNVSQELYSWIVDGREPGKAKRAHPHTEIDVWARWGERGIDVANL